VYDIEETWRSKQSFNKKKFGSDLHVFKQHRVHRRDFKVGEKGFHLIFTLDLQQCTKKSTTQRRDGAHVQLFHVGMITIYKANDAKILFVVHEFVLCG
jgi:hypothetical protein